MPGVRNVLITAGGGFLGRISQGNIYVRTAPHDERTFGLARLWHETLKGDPLEAFRGNYSQRDVMAQVRQRLRKFRDFRILVRNIPGFNIGGGSFDIDFVLRGPDLEALSRYAEELRTRAIAMGGIADPDTTLRLDRPELRVRIDRERAGDLRVDTEQIATALRLMVGGDTEVSRFRDPTINEDYYVQLRLSEKDRGDLGTISRLLVSRQGVRDRAASASCAWTTWCRSRPGYTASRIDRSDRQREVRLRAVVLPGFGQADRIAALRGAVAEMRLPPGYTTAISGRARELERTFTEFLWVFLLSVVFMYMILAAQFESLIHPLTILLSLPLSVPFALLSLWYTGNTLNLYSALGILVLFGVVKKNAILQIDHMNNLRAEGHPPRRGDHARQPGSAAPHPHDHAGPGGGHAPALGGDGAGRRGAPGHRGGRGGRPDPLAAPDPARDAGRLLDLRGHRAGAGARARVLPPAAARAPPAALAPRRPRAVLKGADAVELQFLNFPDAPPPPPTAAYSHAVRAGDHLFVTGQLGVDPATGKLVPGGTVAQTRQVMDNLKTVLRGAGTSLDRAVMARVYLTDFADYPAVNAEYARHFAPGRLPARTTVGVTALALGGAVEIDLIVRL